MQKLERLYRETGREYALRTIKANIISLEIAPGSQVSENELAAELDLSRTPVREAIIELSKVKVVNVYPQKKSVVSLIDPDLVEESFFMRNVLEQAVAEQNCRTIQPEEMAKLKENLKLQNFYLDNFDPERLLALDDEFHQMLFQYARKTQVWKLMQNIAIHLDRVRSMTINSVKNLKVVKDHENIVLAIEQGDVTKARSLMEEHLSRHKVDMITLQKEYPQYFK